MRQTTNQKHLEVKKSWYLVDAKNQVLGRLAQFIATRLRGKHRPDYTPNVDSGDSIVVINANKIRLSAKKEDAKLYIHHTGYPGGLKVATAREVREKKPKKLLEKAIWGMMPRSKLARKQITKLFIYEGSEHKHQSQNPQFLDVDFRLAED